MFIHQKREAICNPKSIQCFINLPIIKIQSETEFKPYFELIGPSPCCGQSFDPKCSSRKPLEYHVRNQGAMQFIGLNVRKSDGELLKIVPSSFDDIKLTITSPMEVSMHWPILSDGRPYGGQRRYSCQILAKMFKCLLGPLMPAFYQAAKAVQQAVIKCSSEASAV